MPRRPDIGEELLSLDDPSCRRTSVAGGKGAGLARLVAWGAPVPPAVVVPTYWLRAHLRTHKLMAEVQASDPALPDRIRAAPIDTRLARALERAVARLGGGPVAVRSSAVDEDSERASHAGQLHTELAVMGQEDVCKAVLDCWASAFSGRVRAYRASVKGTQRVEVAVVVQQMLAPESAGVLFTVHPASGSWRELMVEAAWGVGESVVSGRVLPDLYVLRRPPRVPASLQRLWARARLVELSREVYPQDHELVSTEQGLVERPVPPSRRTAPKLDNSAVRQLARLALRMEAAAGRPLDLEWARTSDGALYVLQARPITTHRSVRGSEAPPVFTRRFVGERWTVPATPLGWSLMREQLEWFIAYPHTSRRYLGGGEPTRLHRFAPYLNTTVFRHLAFKVPGAPPPRFMLELLPPAEEAAWVARRAAMPDARVYASIVATTLKEQRWKRFRWNPLRNWSHWAEFAADLPGRLRDLPPAEGAALARDEACRGLARRYIGIHICSLLFANIGHEVVSARLRSRGYGELVDTVLRPLHPSATARTLGDLFRLGRGSLDPDTFLARHGLRAESSWEMFTPRWREDPSLAWALAKTAAEGHDPLAPAELAAAEADAAQATLPPDLQAAVTLVRRYLQLREDQRAVFERLVWAWKEAWLSLETETGLSLRFLDADEATGVLRGSLNRAHAEALIERRATDHAAECARRAAGDEPPTFLGAPMDAPHDRRLRGRGISPGVARGPVCVLRRLSDGPQLRQGDVLVARATDPGWTPLFRRASALVLEQGGMLSHGAVVAREYGLPAVVNVPDATSRLKPGEVVTVDGGRGLVVSA